MAKQKLSELQRTNVVSSSDLTYIVQSGISKSANLGSILSSFSTANIKENNANLYYTNARVRSAISVTGAGYYDITTGTISINAVATNYVANLNGLSGNVVISTANISEIGNLYYTNARVYSNVIGLLNNKASVGDLTTSNIAELNNLFYSNSRVYSNVIGLLDKKANVSDITTANVVELTNLFYSNTRVYSNISPLLTTANVTEITNLYYSNDRVRSAISAGDQSIIYNPALGTIRANIELLSNGNINISAVATTDEINEGSSNLYYTNARVYSNVIVLLDLKSNVADLTTANIVELGNLYYSNDRVYSNISPLLTTANIVELGNLYYSNDRVYSNISPLLTTANIVELGNLYFTNARVYSNVIGLLNQKADNIDLTTANIAELNNLYFTNARAILSTIPAVTQYEVNNISLSYVIDQYPGLNPTIYVTAGETISFHLIHEAAHPLVIREYTAGPLYNTGLTHVADNGTITTGASAQQKHSGKLFWKIPFDLAGNTFVYESYNQISMHGEIVIQGAHNQINTNELIEGNNLFYTNSRVLSNVLYALQNGEFSDVNVIGNVSITGQFIGDGSGLTNVAPNLITYGGNVLASNITAYSGIFSSNVTAANIVATTFYGDGSQLTGIGTPVVIFSELAKRANIISLTTANVLELSNLYYTNTRVFSNVINIINTRISTSNVSEGSNLYYTNARAISAFTAGDNLLIHANGRIDANVTISTGVVLNANSITVSGNVTANNFVSTGTGSPTLQSSTNINLTANNAVVITKSVLRLASFTQSEINALSASNGDIVFNTSNNKFQGYTTASGWVNLN
jgi:hypothetical protein